MKSIPFVSIIILLWALLSSPSLSQQKNSMMKLAKLWSVHVDEVSSSSIREFDRLDSKQSTIRDSLYHMNQIPVTPVYSFRTRKGKSFSLKAKTSFGEIDQATIPPSEAKHEIDSMLSTFSDTVHTLLRHHHNELWTWDSLKSWCSPDMKTFSGAMKNAYLRAEWVKPGMEEVYDSVMTKYAEALRKTDDIVLRLTFYSQYGSGAVYSIFFAEDPEHLQPIIQRQSLLIEAFGMQEAVALTQSWSACLTGSEEAELVIDLSATHLSPDASWFGMEVR